MKPPFKTIEDASAWARDHEAKHVRFEGEVRAQVDDAIGAGIRHVEKLVSKDGPLHRELEKNTEETLRQTPIIKRLVRGQRRQAAANAKADAERIDRKAQEAVFRAWVKRLGAAIGAVAIAIEFIARVIVPIFKDH